MTRKGTVKGRSRKKDKVVTRRYFMREVAPPGGGRKRTEMRSVTERPEQIASQEATLRALSWAFMLALVGSFALLTGHGAGYISLPAVAVATISSSIPLTAMAMFSKVIATMLRHR